MVGVGYRHRTGTIFFTKNGRKLEDAYTGLRWNLFPTVGANGPCQVHVNLGQMGFVFIEANVKKWGLVPSQGTLAPPPAYGLERDTILLASSNIDSNHHDGGGSSSSTSSHHGGGHAHQQQDVVIPMVGGGNTAHEPPPYTSQHHQDENSSSSRSRS